jgi:predicted unusual protein kinase regulating ubiquinone biosynthesis (AarF/ABC1/UbiB family)
MIRHRYRRIVFFFERIVSSFIFWELVLPRLGLRSWVRQTRSKRLSHSAALYRSLAIQMGGVLIKVGQFLSTRVDVLPVEVTSELSGLQDEVPPESFEDIRRVAEAEYREPLQKKFAFFEESPLAAASLGQVHRARLPEEEGGRDVVVKIQRPDIESIIATDLAALRTVGNWLKRYRPISRRADIPALLAEFTRILYEEIDYLAEGRNAETFSANFRDNPGVRVPSVVWTHTTKRALTLENVWAIKITDYDQITAAGIDRAEVASRLLDTYLQQIFEDGFFHADPHPGNLFIYPLPETENGEFPQTEEGEIEKNKEWQLTFVDFGMVGRVPNSLKEGLRETLIGVGTQNAGRVVKSYQMMGILLPSADLELLEKAEARVFEQFWGRNMSELTQISMDEVREFTGEFRDLIYSMPFQVPHDFIFLARAVAILSGMCTGLDPEFNVWNHLAPFAEKLIAEEATGNWQFWLDEAKTFLGSFVSIPLKLDTMLGKMDRGDIAVRAPDIVKQLNRLESTFHRITGGIVFAAFLLGGIQLYLSSHYIFAYILLVGAFISLIWVLITRS